jgi:tetratricopeptide (TPR) repeat protein
MRIFSSKTASGFLVPAVSIFVSLYLMLAGTVMEDDILHSEIWTKKGIYSPVFDAKKVLSVFFQNIMAPSVRQIIADMFMIKTHDAWHEGRWYRIPEYLEMVTTMQPEWVDGWTMGAWHMAYNVTYEVLQSAFLSPAAQKEEYQWWIDRATLFLKRGISFNYDKYDLYFELGWTYYNKIKNYDQAIKYYQQAARFPYHPEYIERLIAYSYEKKGDRKKALELLKNLRLNGRYHKNDPAIISILNGNIKRIEKESQ